MFYLSSSIMSCDNGTPGKNAPDTFHVGIALSAMREMMFAT